MTETHSVIVIPRWAPLDRVLAIVARVVTGRHSWGFLESSSAGRGIWMREQLVLFPPDISLTERRALTLFRHAPVTGACVAMATMVLIGSVMPPGVAFAVAFGLYALFIVASAKGTARLRRESIRLVVLTVATGEHAVSYGNVERLTATRAALMRIDAREKAGELSPAEHDLECAAVFMALELERADLDLELQRDLRSLEGHSL